jgi:hypothetical protein
MPTIDELAPATAASDTDLLMTDQSGITRKVTRAQIVSGLQPQFALSPGSLIGRASSGIGPAETLSVGSNLVLTGGTLSAVASSLLITAMPAGKSPGAADMVPLSQGGTNVAVSYGQFAMGIPVVPGLDISGATITPAGSGVSEVLGSWAAGVALLTGGTLSGGLTVPTVVVEGACTCSGTLTAGEAVVEGALEVAGAISAAGSLSASGIITPGTLTVGGAAVVSGTIATTAGLNVNGGVAVMPPYQVSALPAATSGAIAYAANGRKTGEAAGAGTGVLVWRTGNQWLSVMSGTAVEA